MIIKLESVSKSQGLVTKTKQNRLLDPIQRVSDSEGQGGGPRIHVSNNFPAGTNATGQGTTH